MATHPAVETLRQIVDAPQYQRGSGPDQLPYGQAQGLNDAATGLPTAPQGTALPDAGAPPADSAPVPPSGAEQPAQAAFTPTSDAEAYLTSPSASPMAAQPLQGLNAQDYADWVMPLADAANRPDASDATKAMFNAVMLGPLP